MAEPSRSTGDPRRLDWGKITTEFYHDQLKLALHVFNHDLQSAENVRRTIRFVVARLKWFEKHLPPGSKQALRFDDRGRIASDSVKQAIRAAVGSRVTSVVFTSEPAK